MFPKTRACGLFTFFLLFSGAAFAQISAIEGDVMGADGQPVVKAQILIERIDMKGTYKGATTNKKGHYIYNGLPLGTYKVSVLVDGQVADFMDKVRTRLGDPIPVNFDLKAKVAQAKEVQKAAETGTMTKEMERSMSKEQKAEYEKRAKENAEAMKKNKELNDAFNVGKEAMLDATTPRPGESADDRKARQIKDYTTAIESFQKGTEMDPNQHVIWGQLAEAEIEMGNLQTGADQAASHQKGVEAYAKAVALKPDDASYRNNYALALVKVKKISEAQAELAKAAQLDPPGAGKYYYNLGAVLTNIMQNDAAAEAFKKAIEADPNYADAHYQYAITQTAKATVVDGKIVPPPGTIEELQKYLELKPDGANAEAAKGLLKELTGSVQTVYVNPNAPKGKAPAKKKP